MNPYDELADAIERGRAIHPDWDHIRGRFYWRVGDRIMGACAAGFAMSAGWEVDGQSKWDAHARDAHAQAVSLNDEDELPLDEIVTELRRRVDV